MRCIHSPHQNFPVPDCLRRFAQDETGAVTVDMMPIMMMAVSMGVAVTGEIADGVRSMSVGIETSLIMGVDPTADGNRQIFGALDGWGGGAIVVASADTGSEGTTSGSTTPSDTGTSSSETDTSSETGTSSETDTSSDTGTSSASGPGNPGNDKAVGKAGETPNGDDDWGSGSNGRSDAEGSNDGGNSNGNGNGNGNGKNK